MPSRVSAERVLRPDRARARRRADLLAGGPLVLVIDTATRLESVALVRGGRLLALSARRSERGASAVLLPEVERALADLGAEPRDIDAVAACRGPGSFTGLRVGIASALGLADGTGRPLFGFTSLEARAASLPAAPLPVCVVIDARKGEVYGAVYDVTTAWPAPLVAECVAAPARFAARVGQAFPDGVLVAGDGLGVCSDLDREAFGPRARFLDGAGDLPALDRVGARVGRRLAAGERPGPEEAAPLYLRASDAEVKAASPPS